MTVTPRAIRAALAATVALLILPAPALAEYLVPSGNSAVTQYTEGFPTAGGEKGSEGSHKKKPVPPAKGIGAKNAKRLEDQGAEGRAAAEVAAETAPPGVTTTNVKDHSKHHKGGSRQSNGGDREENSTGASPARNGSGPGGSSGIGEVLAAATGSSDNGSLGLLLPLVILVAIAWSLVYFWRQRKRSGGAVTSEL